MQLYFTNGIVGQSLSAAAFHSKNVTSTPPEWIWVDRKEGLCSKYNPLNCGLYCGLWACRPCLIGLSIRAARWELLRLDFWQRERWISRCFEDWDVFQRGRKTREAKSRMCSHYIDSMQHFMIIFLYQPLQQPPNHYKCPQMPSVKIGWQSWGCVTFFQKYTAQLRAKEAGSGMQGLWWSSLGPQ